MSDVNDLWNGLWERLADGVAHPGAAARTLCLATQHVDGGGSARMVVLRDAKHANTILTFYTHAGSAKVAELKAQPKAEVLLWDAATQFQARLSVVVDCAAGPKATWETFSKGARLNYVPSLEPGRAIDAPYVPDAAGSEAFLVLRAKITSADILDLSALPHKRAIFEAHSGFTGQWVAP